MTPEEACRIAGQDPARALTMIGELVVAVREDGHTPLHCAAGRGQAEVVAALLAAGTPVNAVDHRGRTPLAYARWTRHTGCAALLEAAGGVLGPGRRA